MMFLCVFSFVNNAVIAAKFIEGQIINDVMIIKVESGCTNVAGHRQVRVFR